jgi:hypothetical protein
MCTSNVVLACASSASPGVNRSSSAEPVRTDSEIFPDGCAIEFVREPGTGKGTLLAFNGQRHEISRRIEMHGEIFEALEVHDSILRAVMLAESCTSYGTTADLFASVSEIIARVAPESSVTGLASFIFCTWFPELMSSAPLVWIIVPPLASCTALAQILCKLARRGLRLAELTTAGLRSLPMYFRPTIVADVPRETPDLIRALRASSQPASYIPSRTGAVDLFCPKVVFANQPLRDRAAAGLFPLEFTLPSGREYATPMRSGECERMAAQLLPKLLRYRLSNYQKVAAAQLDVDKFTPPTQQIARALAGCIVDDEQLQSRVISELKPHDEQIQLELASVLEALIVEALLTECHAGRSSAISIGAITKSTNTILAGRGDSLEVSPETVGWRLRALGLHSEFIAGGRKGLRLTAGTIRRIHALAAAYGVRTLRIGTISGLCSLCDELLIRPPGSTAP